MRRLHEGAGAGYTVAFDLNIKNNANQKNFEIKKIRKTREAFSRMYDIDGYALEIDLFAKSSNIDFSAEGYDWLLEDNYKIKEVNLTVETECPYMPFLKVEDDELVDYVVSLFNKPTKTQEEKELISRIEYTIMTNLDFGVLSLVHGGGWSFTSIGEETGDISFDWDLENFYPLNMEVLRGNEKDVVKHVSFISSKIVKDVYKEAH